MYFKEWLLREEQEIRGEYWIHDDGGVDFADADAGDWSHEGIVENNLKIEIANEFGIDNDDEYFDWDQAEPQMADEILDQWGFDEAKKEEYLNDYHPIEIIEQYFKKNKDKESLEKLSVITGKVDAREYAIFKWGWKAIRGHFIETRALTQRDLKAIAMGLEEIIEQELSWIDNEEDIQNMEFGISVYPNGPNFSLTLAEINAKAKGIQTSVPQQRPKIDPVAAQNVAKQQLKQADKELMHPYYQQKEFPFGDWKL